jgi:8-oxo-dGTP pyrophosphatase MutT (NUDIX family)
LGKATKKGGPKKTSGKAAKTRAAKGATGGKPKKSAKGASGKAARKGPVRRQYAALPYRAGADGRLEVLLATSRETKRWVIPKGWPMKGLKPHKAAAREAFEETGAVGRPAKDAIGTYVYWKRLKDSFVLCRVKVFPLRVEHLEETWSEQDERERRWFPQGEAAARVEEPGLRALVAGFAPAAKAPKAEAPRAEASTADEARPPSDPRPKRRGKAKPAQGSEAKKRAAKRGKAAPARKPKAKKRAAKARAS